jgi:hypothetical protein
LAITTALTLRAVFRLALRQTEGLSASLLWLLGLDLGAPDHSTIGRRGETLQCRDPDRAANRYTCWWTAQGSTTPRRSWRKLDIGEDADTGQIFAADLISSDVR